jgi:hypothetical protein
VTHVDADLVGAGRVGHINLVMTYNDLRNPQGTLDVDVPILGKRVTAYNLVSLFDDDRPSIISGDQLKGQEGPPDKKRRHNDKYDVTFLHENASLCITGHPVGAADRAKKAGRQKPVKRKRR